MVNMIWKPDCRSSLWLTSTLLSASITVGGAGTATVGPMSSVR